MKNDLFSIGPLTVHGYGLMIAIGIIAAYLAAEYRAKKLNLEYQRIFDLLIWCVVGGMIGAKLLYYITVINEVLENPKILLNVADGFVVYGGIIGGILAGFLFCKKYKLSFLKYFDLTMPSIALAQGFGRLGCLLAGCCYGLETKSPIHIIFENSKFAPNGIALIPTQIISSGLDFLNFFVLIFLAKRKKADGQIAALYLIFYSAGRYIIEFYRGDLVRGKVGNLTTSQFISIFLFIIGCALFVAATNRAKQANLEVDEDGMEEEDMETEGAEEEVTEEENTEVERTEKGMENEDTVGEVTIGEDTENEDTVGEVTVGEDTENEDTEGKDTEDETVEDGNTEGKDTENETAEEGNTEGKDIENETAEDEDTEGKDTENETAEDGNIEGKDTENETAEDGNTES